MTSHILVVDDDQSIREALERGLRLEGFNVRSVSDGELEIKAVLDIMAYSSEHKCP